MGHDALISSYFFKLMLTCSIDASRVAIVAMISLRVLRGLHLYIEDALAALALPQSEPGLTRLG
jgi:hypothetical protein